MSKPANKAKAPTKKKPLADVDENADDSIVVDNASDVESGPSVHREAPKVTGKKKTASETYTKVSFKKKTFKVLVLIARHSFHN